METTPQPSRLPKWTQAFIPNREIAVTPVIISANIIVWLLMIAAGVSPYMPTVDDALAWGANSSEMIQDGQYWRLWTSNFLHYGFLHLGVNMLSLHNVGRLLERFIGKWRFALLYTITGIFASATSAWWNPYGIGVGASGAILGIVGVLTALLTTNLIDKAIRWHMLRSIGLSILLMLLIGLNSSIDNAAHLGGLLAGAVGGYFIYPELKAYYYEHKKQYWGLIAALVLTAGGIGFLVVQSEPPRDPVELFAAVKRNTMEADQEFASSSVNSSQQIKDKIIPKYETARKQLDTLSGLGLTVEADSVVKQYREYIKARIIYYEFAGKALDSKDPALYDSANSWDVRSKQIEPIIFLSEE